MAQNSGSLVTNVLKLVHGWQNYRQQKELFYKDCDDIFAQQGVVRQNYKCTLFNAQLDTYRQGI